VVAILGPILSAAASSGTAFALSRLFGGDTRQAPAPVRVPTLGEVLDLGRRDSLSEGISRAFGEQAGLIGDLRQQVRPGFGRLTETRLRGVRDAGRRTIGDLRENLARRRVLGSSFAGDAIARQELAIADQADAIRADAFLKELQLSNDLIDSEFGLRRGELETLLNEQTFRDKISVQLARASVNTQTAAMRQQALLASQRGSRNPFLNSLGSSAGTAIGRGLGSAVGNLSSNLASGGLLSPTVSATPIS